MSRNTLVYWCVNNQLLIVVLVEQGRAGGVFVFIHLFVEQSHISHHQDAVCAAQELRRATVHAGGSASCLVCSLCHSACVCDQARSTTRFRQWSVWRACRFVFVA